MTYQYIFEPPYDKIDVFACGLLFLQFLTKKEKIFEEIIGEELDRINVETFFINCIIEGASKYFRRNIKVKHLKKSAIEYWLKEPIFNKHQIEELTKKMLF